jgi:hypothetical protein
MRDFPLTMVLKELPVLIAGTRAAERQQSHWTTVFPRCTVHGGHHRLASRARRQAGAGVRRLRNRGIWLTGVEGGLAQGEMELGGAN